VWGAEQCGRASIAPTTGPRRLLIGALVVLLVLLIAYALVGTTLIAPRFAVDMEIPLRAAERWLAGEPPYQPEAFTSAPGATQPFLYPPYVLPFFALLSNLPRMAVGASGVVLMLVAAIVAGRRVGIPWLWLPLVLAWPPFAEAIFGANVQMLLFAGFVFLFYRPGAKPWTPAPRAIEDPNESAAFVGVLATVVGAIKVSQPHPWLYVLRHRPRGALIGVVAVVGVVAATVLVTGLQPWFDWSSQLRLASDPTWDLGGFAVTRFLPPGLGLIVATTCVMAVVFVPTERAGAWVGLLSVVGALSLHIFGLLFLVPAMLLIRIEAALVAAVFVATYSYEGAWAGILICAAGMLVVERAARSPAAELCVVESDSSLTS
jgi:hypothetical protein